MLPFEGKLALITGASSGIGAALAKQLALGGATVAIAARREDRLRTLEAEIHTLGGKAFVVPCDVSVDGQLQPAIAAIHASVGVIDIVVANAGMTVGGELETLVLDDYRRQLEANVFGMLRTVFATLDDLKERRGTLVLLGSVAGYVAAPGSSPYAMSKFAVRALANALAPELKPHGVKVVLVSPGFVDSEIRRIDKRGVLHDEGADPVPRWLRMRTDVAARKIARAVSKGQREIILTRHGKVIVFLSHHLPGLLRFLASRNAFRRHKRPARRPE